MQFAITKRKGGARLLRRIRYSSSSSFYFSSSSFSSSSVSSSLSSSSFLSFSSTSFSSSFFLNVDFTCCQQSHIVYLHCTSSQQKKNKKKGNAHSLIAFTTLSYFLQPFSYFFPFIENEKNQLLNAHLCFLMWNILSRVIYARRDVKARVKSGVKNRAIV